MDERVKVKGKFDSFEVNVKISYDFKFTFRSILASIFKE